MSDNNDVSNPDSSGATGGTETGSIASSDNSHWEERVGEIRNHLISRQITGHTVLPTAPITLRLLDPLKVPKTLILLKIKISTKTSN